MNVAEIIDVNTWLVQNADHPIDQCRLDSILTEQFWPKTKIRNQRWLDEIARIEPELRFSRTAGPNWLRWAFLSQETALAESTFRIWCSLFSAQIPNQDLVPMVLQILKDILATRKRLDDGWQSAPLKLKNLARQIQSLTKLIERLGDLMISQLPAKINAKPFAFNPNAFDEFARCAQGYDTAVIRQANVALSVAFSQEIQKLSIEENQNDDVDIEFIKSIIQMFPSADRQGLPVQFCSESADFLTFSGLQYESASNE
ncbi:MAG: hypothetical protein AAGA30_06315 [Planctomycetota bacterium]